MISLNFGEIPDDLTIDEPYRMSLNTSDFYIVSKAINQGIDSHLEAVFFTQDDRKVTITDSASMKTFLRRLCETEDGSFFASCIMETLGYEWI